MICGWTVRSLLGIFVGTAAPAFGADDGQQTAQEARHDATEAEPIREPTGQETATPAPSHAFGEVVQVQAIAACQLIEEAGRGEGKPAPSAKRKTRRRRGT